MLLVDQVGLLDQNFVQLRNQEFALPLMGGLSATSETYQFKSLVHPARDFATTIAKAAPRGDKLPTRLRGWNLNVTDEFRKTRKIPLKDLLGRVIHTYYLRIGHGDLDISNDLGKRVIVPYNVFLDSVQRLVLTPEDICLVICGLAEEEVKNENALRELTANTPGSGNLEHCLVTIKTWPPLQESIWKTFFAGQSSTVRRDCRTAYDKPFIKGRRHSGTTVLWHVGWQRDDTYAEAWIDVLHLTGKIQDYFTIPRLK